MTDLHPIPGGPALLRSRAGRHGASRVAELPVEAGRDTGALLRGDTREVLARLADGDPLGLRPRVARALLRRRLLLDASRAWLRAAALVARRGARRRPRGPLEGWIDLQVERALDGLVAEAAPGPPTERELELALSLGLAPERLPAALARFHALPHEVRDAYFRLVLEGDSLDELVHSRGAEALRLARQARVALTTLLVEPGPRDRSRHLTAAP